MKKILGQSAIKQFLSYFLVGGIAAIVEWVMFFLFASIMNMHYILATCLAFCFSTTANWFLGKVWTFKDNNRYKDKSGQEIFLVFAVSGIGLCINMFLMYIFVSLLGLNTNLLKTAAKILATGIVFFWNFLIRKYVIYKES